MLCSSLHLAWQFPSNVSSPKINIESDKSGSKAQKNIFLNLIAISPCFLSWWMAKSIKMIYYNIGIWNNMKNLITLLKTTGAYLRAQTIETSSLPTIPRGPSSSKSNVIMMTFLLFAPASTKWLGWRKDRKSRRDRSGRFCDIYWAVILRYSFALRSDILWSSCFESCGPKDLVKRRGGYKVRLTVYI